MSGSPRPIWAYHDPIDPERFRGRVADDFMHDRMMVTDYSYAVQFQVPQRNCATCSGDDHDPGMPKGANICWECGFILITGITQLLGLAVPDDVLQ